MTPSIFGVAICTVIGLTSFGSQPYMVGLVATLGVWRAATQMVRVVGSADYERTQDEVFAIDPTLGDMPENVWRRSLWFDVAASGPGRLVVAALYYAGVWSFVPTMVAAAVTMFAFLPNQVLVTSVLRDG